MPAFAGKAIPPALVAAEIEVMDLLKRNLPAVAGIVNRFKLARIWRREFLRVRAELKGCSERQLKGDLRLFPSEIAGVAAEAADQHVTAFVRNHPDYRGA